ncbi:MULTISPECIES: permease [Aeromonas]|uniref:permease n=1 Tax=Aeromonas TaxID=642 RepID=UPI001C235B00|nr:MULTISPECIES: permease [Aeromonas]QWZ95393.1 permease [Aeromonas sp. FDAARGOS 1411]UPK54187.1 permease [Aeromonas veronii]UYB72585.1 permease [Aeromonas veronii]HDZ8981334.1 permease [Aeromonas veronii]HEA3127617.1 permease [Aeromonas veronii]
MNEWLTMLTDAAQMFLFLAVELSVLFLVISAGVSLIRQKIPDEKIQRMLGARHGKGYLLSALLGAVTPFCSCSTIPMLRGLLSAKAGFGPTLTFLFISPLLNPIIVGLMWATFGWKVTLLYAVIAASVSVMASMLLDRLGFERHVIDPKEATPSCGSDCGPATRATTQTNCSDNQRGTIRAIKQLKGTACCPAPQPEMAEQATLPCCGDGTAALTRAPQLPTAWVKARIDAWQQFKTVLPFLLLGVLIGSFIYGFIPAEWIAAHAGADNPLAIPFSAIVGIPLYIRAEAVIPLASVLLGKGMGMGAVMALIIGSAGASLTEVILLKSMFRTPMIAAFLTVILGMAILMGYLTQLLF